MRKYSVSSQATRGLVKAKIFETGCCGESVSAARFTIMSLFGMGGAAEGEWRLGEDCKIGQSEA